MAGKARLKSTESRNPEGTRPSDDPHHTALCNLWCRLTAKTVENRDAHKPFFENADRNYLLARICWCLRMDYEFSWNTAQCIEKYCKSFLLFNNYSAKEGGHDIVKLFDLVFRHAADLIPATLSKLEVLDACWTDVSVRDFISRINDLGDPSNRYSTFSHALLGDEIFKLDFTVFALRRICVDLSRPIAHTHDPNESLPSCRSFLQQHPEAPIHSDKPHEEALRSAPNEKSKEMVSQFFLDANIPFSNGQTHLAGMVGGGLSASNSSVYLEFFEKRVDSLSYDEIRQKAYLVNWCIKNICFYQKNLTRADGSTG